MTTDEFLSAGLAAAQAGDRARARDLFAKAVQANPQSEKAWLHLGLVLEEQERRQFCFQRVLALNPQNEQARQQLFGSAQESVENPPNPDRAPSPTGQDAKAGLRVSDQTPQSQALAGSPEQADEPAARSDVRPAVSPGQVQSAASPAPAWATESAEKRLTTDAQPPASVPSADPLHSVAKPTPKTEPPVPVASQTPVATTLESETEEPAGRFERILIALLGIVVGLLLCGGPILFVVQTGRVDPLLPVALVPPFVPTATPTIPTPTPTRTPTPVPPTPIPSSTPTLTKQQLADAAAADAARAESLMSLKSYAEAIPVWDRVIAAGPDNGKPYIRRASAYLQLLSNQRNMSEYVDYLDKALADTDKAIALGPATGDYYLERFRVYYNLAGTEYFRVDRDRLYELARENLKIAIALGNTQGASELDVADTDLLLGQCDQGINTINRVLASTGRTASSDAYASTLLSQGYLCKGKFDEALRYIDLAIKQGPGCCRPWMRAIILTNMGRLNDALTQLNEMIDASPHYAGYRYYLRALIYYDLKKPDLAKEDLIEGAGNTWSRYDLMSYVLGRMALDSGDKKTGIEQLRLAEATFSIDYGPLINRVRRDLKQLNAVPLSPTLSIPYKATPITMPKATATPTKPKAK